MSKLRLKNSEHQKYPWKVHQLLSDYEVEDVWRIPVKLSPSDSLKLLIEEFTNTTTRISTKGLAGVLFKIRLAVGKLMGWDEKPPKDILRTGSIRERYAMAEGLTGEELPDPGDGDFEPVYLLEDEYLSEIENSTVKAALHIGRHPDGEGGYGLQMGVYVKPKGLFGRIYMAIIKPFRLWIVYPALLKSIASHWKKISKV